MAASFAMYYVYILYSHKSDSFYKGQSVNLESRLQRHNNKKEKSTQSGVPWILVWTTSKETRSSAMMLESKIKNLNRQRTIQFMLKYADDITGQDELLIIQQLSRC